MNTSYQVGLLIVFIALGNAATLSVSNTLGSNMVLQRAPASANIWGSASPSVSVTVALGTQKKVATVDESGNWIIALDPVAAGGPYSIVVTSSDNQKLTLDNVLFGEVWLCGGQSNMQFTVDSVFNASVEVATADKYPDIRVMTVGQSHYSATPLMNLAGIAQNWSVASKVSIGVGNWSEFSAVCWFTGKNLYDDLKVPIGLISSNWGGTVIQAWSSPQALKDCNVTTSGTGNEANSVLYNAMIVPFLNYVIRGVLWYQGEQNSGQAALYSCMFPAMITNWRTNWATATGIKFPFLFVQLAPYTAGPGSGWADTRQAQLAALKLSNVGFASAVDLGDPTSPFGSVHPRNKQEVGRRLSLAARNIVYGESSVVWEGPTFASAVNNGVTNGIAKVTVTFKVYGASGLVSKSSTCPVSQGVPLNNCANWMIKFSNETWVAAEQSVVNGNSVTVSTSGVKAGLTVTGVSYAYSSWPIITLYSKEGLPVIPFEYAFP